MNDRFMFRLPFYNNKGEFSHFEFILIGESLPAYNAGVMFHRDEYEQCTGLKDKNGNLIYEGDIVKIPDDWETYGFMSGEKREVYFRDGGFRLKPKDTKLGRGHWLEQTSALEIIGNIHEQAEQKEEIDNE